VKLRQQLAKVWRALQKRGEMALAL
jgi:hypothetical protein